MRTIQVTADGEVMSADGCIVKGLYYVGPWLRARNWEATAVPELREHARRLAERLAGTAIDDRHHHSQSVKWQVAVAEQAADFMFQLTAEESENLRSHSAISNWGGRR